MTSAGGRATELACSRAAQGFFSLGWTRGDYEKAVGANGVGPFDGVHDDIVLTASYALAPGITVDGLLEYSRYRSNDAAGPDYQGLGLGIGAAIAI